MKQTRKSKSERNLYNLEQINSCYAGLKERVQMLQKTISELIVEIEKLKRGDIIEKFLICWRKINGY